MLREDVFSGLDLQCLILEREQRPCLPHEQFTCDELVLDRHCELQEAQRVGDVRAAAADLLREHLLRQLEILHEEGVGLCLLDDVEVLTLDVLDQGDLTDLGIVIFSHKCRYFFKSCFASGAQAALTRDELIALLRQAPDDQGLQDAVLADGLAEILERRLVEILARLIAVGPDLIGRDLLHLILRRRDLAVLQERAESFAEAAVSLTHHAPSPLLPASCKCPFPWNACRSREWARRTTAPH